MKLKKKSEPVVIPGENTSRKIQSKKKQQNATSSYDGYTVKFKVSGMH